MRKADICRWINSFDSRKFTESLTMEFVQTSQVLQYNFECFTDTAHTDFQESVDDNIKNRNESQANIAKIHGKCCRMTD